MPSRFDSALEPELGSDVIQLTRQYRLGGHHTYLSGTYFLSFRDNRDSDHTVRDT